MERLFKESSRTNWTAWAWSLHAIFCTSVGHFLNFWIDQGHRQCRSLTHAQKSCIQIDLSTLELCASSLCYCLWLGTRPWFFHNIWLLLSGQGCWGWREREVWCNQRPAPSLSQAEPTFLLVLNQCRKSSLPTWLFFSFLSWPIKSLCHPILKLSWKRCCNTQLKCCEWCGIGNLTESGECFPSDGILEGGKQG